MVRKNKTTIKRSVDHDGLTPMQRKFVEGWIANGGNSLQAYKAAGYSMQNKDNQGMAAKVRRNPAVARAIHQRLDQAMVLSIMDVRVRSNDLEKLRMLYWGVIEKRKAEYAALHDSGEAVPNHALNGMYIRKESRNAQGRLTTEWVLDKDLHNAMLDLHRQAAKEMGVYDVKVEVNVTANSDEVQTAVSQLMALVDDPIIEGEYVEVIDDLQSIPETTLRESDT